MMKSPPHMVQARREIKLQRNRMVKRRKDRGLSISQLSKISGVSASKINRYENGAEIEITNYAALYSALWL